jgi:hypothetical protein
MVYSKNISVTVNTGVETATTTPVGKITIEIRTSWTLGVAKENPTCKALEKNYCRENLRQFP